MIQNVSDTARWVAVYRAMETERSDALFRDPLAHRLAGERGYAIHRKLGRGGQFAWAMAIRTRALDDLLMALVRDHGVDLVLNLACGFDARPYRLPLPPSLRWVEVDLPPLLEEKRGILEKEKPVCRLETIAVDLADGAQRREMLARATAGASRGVVITEGLLVYLGEENVAALATDLAAQPSLRWWLSDLASPLLLQWMNRRVGKDLQAGNAPMKFAPASGPEFFRPYGWTCQRFLPTSDASEQLGRAMPGAWLWRLFSLLMSKERQEKMRNMAGLLQLGRGT